VSNGEHELALRVRIEELVAIVKRLERKNRRYRRAAENWRRKAVILQHQLNDRSVP
jgi:hypothetical protein